MKLIDNFVEKFHNYSLPTPEKCFVLEEGDELYINKWIKNGKINGKMKDIFEWIEKKYLSKYRYYSKVIISIKDQSLPEMKNKDFLKLFENN